jgi:5-methylcytosine-specific restriction protein B
VALADLTDSDAVRRAAAEHDELGQEHFLAKYGFGPAREYLLVLDGHEYPSKAILGAAHAHQRPDLGPLPSSDFSGGEQTRAKLDQLGFEVQRLSETPAPSLWVVRAGQKGETEEFCLERHVCGVGWPEMPDMSVLDEQALSREVDAAYAGQPARRIGAYKGQLREFMAIRQGDTVLMPLKSRQRQIAVGVVIGPYERREDFPEMARHVRPVDWGRTDVPRELFGDLLKWIDRPTTVSRVPVSPEAVSRMLDSGEVIRLHDDRRERWAVALRQVLRLLAAEAPADDIRNAITAGEAVLRELAGDDWPVGHGAGIGTPAEVPWIGIYPKGSTPTAQRGYYVVYLFAADGSAVYLSLNQGTEKVRGGMGPLHKRALDLRRAAGLTDNSDPIDLRSSAGRPRKYEAGNAHAARYETDAVPDDATLKADLDEFLAYLQAAVDSGLAFDPEIEPVHLLFKWSADLEAQTVTLHEQVAAERGSVWWGKFGQGANPIGSSRLEQINDQLERGVVTNVFLYGGGQTVRTRLEQITVDPDAVDAERMAGYYGTDQCNMFVRLSSFADLDGPWPLTNLALASDPDPAKMQGALGNQTTPLFVHERFAPAPGEGGLSPFALTMDWLVEQTLWPAAELDEVLEALQARGQIILAGPPGTGKTWIAQHVAQYVTQNQPLQIRTIQFHPSYGYEEFVEGLRPVAKDGGISFERTDGVILQMSRDMDGSDATYVLIIDELNRANIPRVFGELLYLLEYRDTDIDLQYSRGFRLPENFKIIATMNTADRSIRSIDVALRRRFEIFECSADAAVLERYYESELRTSTVLGLETGFRDLNADLADRLDRHHAIGHSFFMAETYAPADLRRAWKRQILPLIEDYFFDQPDVVAGFSMEKYWSVS